MKIFILGHGRHGKDTLADLLVEQLPELSFVSSSEFVAEKAVFPKLSKLYGYKTSKECFEDRHAHRAEWHRLISEYNHHEPCRLARKLFEVHDIYVGLRCIRELNDAKKRLRPDLVIWVDRSEHLPPEDLSSNTVTPADCGLIISNNGTLDDLRKKAVALAEIIKIIS